MQFDIIEALYFLFIFPLQFTLNLALGYIFALVKSWGISIILLSLFVNIFLLKIFIWADKKAGKFSALKAQCDTKIAEFKRVFKGAELQSYIRTLYKQKHYHPIFALSALGGLALQVPFFIAVLCLLNEFDGIRGVSFLWIADLSAPDSVLGVHLLPILMTIISLANVWIVAKDRGAKIQGALISLIFLVLLYQMPSALVLYWTTNMAFSLLRALWAKWRSNSSNSGNHSADSANRTKIAESRNDKKTRNFAESTTFFRKILAIFRILFNGDDYKTYRQIAAYAVLCIAFLICVFNPYALYKSDITQFDSSQTIATLSALFGAFLLISVFAIYVLNFIPKRICKIYAFMMSFALFVGIVYSFVLVGDYGAMDRFVFQKTLLPFNDPQMRLKRFVEFGIVAFVGAIFLLFMLKRLRLAMKIIFATLFVVSALNVAQILNKRLDSALQSKIAESTQNSANNFAESPTTPYQNELFSYSKTQKNIVIFVLDMFSGSHMPYILERFPHFNTALDGFTLFPNAISSANATIYSLPSLVAGPYYTIYNMNARGDNTAESSANAYKNIGLSFADAGYLVGFLMFHIQNRNALIAESNIFWLDNHEHFKKYFLSQNPSLSEKLNSGKYFDIWQMLGFGLFKFMPEAYFRVRIYNRMQSHRQKGIDNNTVINHISTLYAATHIGDTNATKPTFKFFHSFITHAPYGIYANNGECNYLNQNTIWENNNPHKPSMQKGRYSYQHFDTEVCALQYISRYIAWLKDEGIYDNTQIFIVSDHAGDDSINIPMDKLKPRTIGPDIIFLFKDFNAKGALKVDNRLMANYDISSIFCENLPNGCQKVGKNILQNYPKTREIIHARPDDSFKHEPNKWLIYGAYKINSNSVTGGGIYVEKNWTDISDEKYGIVNMKK
ncbi:YidC/Oxa1 family membrane protein insertase [Helicobacter sp. 23-1045]